MTARASSSGGTDALDGDAIDHPLAFFASDRMTVVKSSVATGPGAATLIVIRLRPVRAKVRVTPSAPGSQRNRPCVESCPATRARGHADDTAKLRFPHAGREAFDEHHRRAHVVHVFGRRFLERPWAFCTCVIDPIAHGVASSDFFRGRCGLRRQRDRLRNEPAARPQCVAAALHRDDDLSFIQQPRGNRLADTRARAGDYPLRPACYAPNAFPKRRL